MGIRTELRNSFVAGLVLVAPLAVTVVVLQFAFTRLAGLLDPVVQGVGLAALTANIHLFAQALAAVLIVVLVTLLGFLAQRSGGERAVEAFDRLVSLVPLVSVVYTGVRQVSDALTERDTRFQRVVLVEYPRLGVYSLGFVTGEGPEVADEVSGEPTSTVIVPHSPNPTVGHLIVVPESTLHETDLSVRRAIRMLVTTGVAESADELSELQEAVDAPVAAGPHGPSPGRAEE
ncbi:MAG: DUF502 domain-containing protein [Haloarculaceae archaeon]|jgi:uncharacterized membrane protein